MGFDIGETVVHPQHGIGEVTDRGIDGPIEGDESAYTIVFKDQGLTLHLPEERVEEAGLRPPMGKKAARGVLETLSAVPRRLAKRYQIRQSKLADHLQSGGPRGLARVVRDLSWRKQTASLTQRDLSFRREAYRRLRDELATALDTTSGSAEEMMEEALESALSSTQARPIS